MVPFELDSIRRLANPRHRNPWLESALVCIIAFSSGLLVRPLDPLFASESAFSWSLFAPMMIALRYGFIPAFTVAGALHIAAMMHSVYQPETLWPLPPAYSLGLLIMTVIVGEFRDQWDQYQQRLERSNEYRQARLEEFSRSYHILKISHDELEQEHAGKRASLRSALLTTREELLALSKTDDAGALLLQLLGTYASFRTASYHVFDRNGLNKKPSATVGGGGVMHPDDHLIQRALATAVTASLRPDDAEASVSITDHCVAAIPVADAYQRIHAVVVVQQLSFFAFTEKNLQLATIVASRFADYLHAQQMLSSPIGSATNSATISDTLPGTLAASISGPEDETVPGKEAYWDDEVYNFYYQTLRCIDLAQQYRLSSCLMGVTFQDNTSATAYIDTIINETRGLDLALPLFESDRSHLMMLMPLTSRDGLDRFMVRFDGYLQQRHGVGLQNAGIMATQLVIDHRATEHSALDFLGATLQEDSALVANLREFSNNSWEEANRRSGSRATA